MVAMSPAREIGEKNPGAEGELRHNHVRHRDQRNEHRCGDEWHVLDREFHDDLAFKLVNHGCLHNDVTR